MVFFCRSMSLTRPSTSFGLLMNFWIAGIITVEEKSGRVSRSRNCEICLAPETSSTAFFWIAEYPEVSASSLTAMLLGSLLR